MAKIGRNQPCPCGSGKKYKKCCGMIKDKPSTFKKLKPEEIPPEVQRMIEQKKAEEITRQQQQGLGKPIISAEHNGYRFVAVGSRLYYSKSWKTFPDFLLEYIKIVMNGGWGNAEIKKEYNERHPILQWYDHICRLEKEHKHETGEISSFPLTGAAAAYLHLAYNLYLISHNTIKNEFSEKLKDRLVRRLKDRNTFPGAYYETFVCATLICAGYEVEFEDEITDPSQKHCDFNITSKNSSNQYSVEAKSVHRDGSLGATQNTTQADIRQSVRNQLYNALKKPSETSRIIFIDLNLPQKSIEEVMPLVDEAINAVYEAEDNMTIDGQPTDPAYVILTNTPHHQHPEETNITRLAVPVGYKISDFGHGKPFKRIRDAYYAKQKHIEVYNILGSYRTHYHIPPTFDGSLASEAYDGQSDRIVIGETYHFPDIGEEGLTATVTTATISKEQKKMIIGTDKGHIITRPVTDSELADFQRHPDTFFGVVHRQGKSTDDPLEFFETMLSSYKDTPKEKLLEFMKSRKDIEDLKLKPQNELAIIYCEGIVNSILARNNSNNNNENS